MAADLITIRDIAGRVAATHGVELVEVELRAEAKPVRFASPLTNRKAYP